MRILLFIFFLLLFLQQGYAQEYSIIDGKAIKLHQEGDDLVKRRMYDEAIEKYKSSINREAGFLESYIKWGRILLTKGNPDESLKVVERGEARASKASPKVKSDF